MDSNLAEQFANIVSDLPEAIVTGFATTLGNADPQTALSRIPVADTRRRMASAVRSALDAGFSHDAIGLALQSAYCAYRHSRELQSVELVWTGPSPPQTHLRRTDQALLEVIGSAQADVWIVSFAAYGVQTILNALQDALNRNVMVSLVLESADESEGRLSSDQIAALQAALNQQARVYVWPTKMRQISGGRRGTLHAKCAVADGQQLFASSANLTEAALQVNIELGVLINSTKHASLVQRQLRWLVESRILQLV